MIFHSAKYLDYEESIWPPGPYALLAPVDGCPERSTKGWRTGHISFIWKHPHILTTLKECNNNSSNTRLSTANGTDTLNVTTIHRCRQELTSRDWPEIKSNLLGPFEEYEWRLNFCYKIKDEMKDDATVEWPRGLYSIFGEQSGCPVGN